MKRKLLVLLLAALTLFACAALFAACGEGGADGDGTGGGNDEPPQHTHTFADDWTYDETHHWHAATCEHADEVSGMAPHEWNEGTVTLQPGCTEEGERTYICECGAFKKEPIAPTEHTYSDEWTYNGTDHWHAATCGHTGEVSDKAPHEWDGGKITVEPTCTKAGERVYSCACGATKTEPIAALDHAFSSTLTYDGTHHWYPCTRENCNAQKDKAEHVWGEGTVTTEPTCTEEGVKTFTCTCGAARTEPIAPTGHSYSDKWTFDETDHWHAATCGHTGEVSGKAPHEWDEGTVTRQPTCTEKGETKYTCDCGAVKTEPIEPLGHAFSENLAHNDTHHWYPCTHEGCSEVIEQAEHSWQNGVCTECGAKEASEGLAFSLRGQYRGSYYAVTGKGTCTDTDIVIPYEYNGLPVKEIAYNAFLWESTLTSITIPDSITKVGSSAIGYSDLLYNEYENGLYLGNSHNPYRVLVKVKDPSVTSFTCHEDTKIICYGAFDFCTDLRNLTLADGLVSLAEDTFV